MTVIVFLIIALAVVLAIFVPHSAKAKKLTEQINLGNKYLSELNYEQAVVSYLAAIEIDPKNVDAYLGLSDAYVAQGKYDKAISVLEDALKGLGAGTEGAESVQEKLEQVNEAKKAAEATKAPLPTNTPVPTATNTPAPTATNTPMPTATSTPTPTVTPVPTSTSTPSPTPTKSAGGRVKFTGNIAIIGEAEIGDSVIYGT